MGTKQFLWAAALLCGSALAQAPVGKIVINGDTTGLADSIQESLQPQKGKLYSPQMEADVRSTVLEQLAAHGYLEATATVTEDGSDLAVSITPGRQYRISSISAGGGPLLPGRDFSPSFSSKPGDIAGAGAFGRAPEDLRTYYNRFGYADMQLHVGTELDRKQATVAYRMDVIPGPLYHLRSLAFENLTPEQESKARSLLGLKPGDVYDQAAITGLYRKIPSEPLLKGYGFNSTPKEDKTAATVDLTLSFFKRAPGGLIFH
jgi:outer membrane protein assembly factor BamA